MILLGVLLIPIFELAITVNLIRQYGFANTFFAWLFLTIIGVGLLRTSGIRMSVDVAKSMREGKSPGSAALESALVGLAGLLLVIPGFISDAVALFLLIPPFRRWAGKRMLARVKFAGKFTQFVDQFGFGYQSGGPRSGGFGRARDASPGRVDGLASDGIADAAHAVIDVDAVEIDSKAGNPDSEEGSGRGPKPGSSR